MATARPIMCSTLDDALFQSLLWLTQGLNANNAMQVTTMYILGMLRLQSQHYHKKIIKMDQAKYCSGLQKKA